MRYQAALLPDGGYVGPWVPDRNARFAQSGATDDEPWSWLASRSRAAAKAGGPGRIRTYNLAVMSGRLYR